jgi:release factor glutamine methyltransferase
MARLDELRRRYGPELRRDADLFLADLLGRSVAYVHAHGELEVDEEPFDALMRRRAAGEPLQYIRGRADLYGREFRVDDRVLIPRPETEILVEEAIRRLPHGARVLDAGTGSGCIAVTLALERPDLRVFATDVSIAALAVTRSNLRRAPVQLAASDVLDAIRGRFDAVVSNPPYIPAGDVPSLQVEVRAHEPVSALTPGPAGTEVIERLFAAGPAPALVILEIGFGQEATVRAIAERHGYRVEAVVPDLAGIPRVVVSSRAP